MKELEYTSSSGWTMTVNRQAGIRLLVGRLPYPGIDVTVRNAWGDPVYVVSGSKPEYGPGGFEIPIWTMGLYTIRFLDQTFKVNVGDETVTMTFIQQAEPEPEARLVSRWRPLEDARALWEQLQATAELSGLFSVEARADPAGVGQSSDWRIDIERRPGPRLIVGRLPEAAIAVVVADPWGNETHLLSGSKPEHGPGGFDVPVWRDALYTIRFQGQRFTVEVRDDTVFATFTHPGDPQGRVRSEPLPRSTAAELLARLQENPVLQGKFALETVPIAPR